MAFLALLIHIKGRDGVLNNCWKEGERELGKEGRKKERRKGRRDKGEERKGERRGKENGKKGKSDGGKEREAKGKGKGKTLVSMSNRVMYVLSQTPQNYSYSRWGR